MPKEFYGLDISGENGTINWERLDTSGLSFVILRITDKYGIDKEFYRNYDGAKNRGLKVGGYKYSYAKTAEDAEEEAKGVVSTLSGRKLDFPIFYDLESKEQETYSSYKIGTFIEAFHKVIDTAGYKFGIYSNKNWYNNIIPDFAKEKYEFWVAAVPYKDRDDGSVQERLRPNFGVGWQYSWEKKLDGHNDSFDADIFYKDYAEVTDKKEVEKVGTTAKEILDIARSYIGYRESNGSHKTIIDIYNSYKPLARGYAVQYTDQWCDTFVSAVFIKAGAVSLLGGTECGVEEHVKKFKAAGIWIEDGTITPRPGDIIVFNWGQSTQPNDGYSDHIGFVETVSGGTITTIEGNYKDSVDRRRLAVGHGNIRGFARPKYAEATSTSPAPATSTPVAIPITHSTVRLNSYNNDVKVLQQYLNQVGYSLEVDGKFGLRTYSAVRSYQSKNGLSVDGIVGPLTWASLEKKLGSVTAGTKSITEVAKDVIAGKYGNMPNRKANLEAAGYNYDAVQKEVNRLLK